MVQLVIPIGPRGALTDVFIGVSAPRRDSILAGNMIPPMPAPATLLLDTGATLSAIDQAMIDRLGIQPTGAININTPTSGQNGVVVPLYDISMTIVEPGGPVLTLPAVPVTANDFTGQGIDGLLGRDILATGSLFYNGQQNVCFLSL
jgi:hypothetical protein